MCFPEEPKQLPELSEAELPPVADRPLAPAAGNQAAQARPETAEQRQLALARLHMDAGNGVNVDNRCGHSVDLSRAVGAK